MIRRRLLFGDFWSIINVPHKNSSFLDPNFFDIIDQIFGKKIFSLRHEPDCYKFSKFVITWSIGKNPRLKILRQSS